MPGGQGGSCYTNTYNDEPDEEEGLPFHLCCYRDVLLQAVRNYGIINKPTIPAMDEIDTQTLRRMLHGNEEMLHIGFFFVSSEDTRYDDGSLSHALKLDYGTRANDKLRSTWQCRRGDEAYVSHPVEISWLVEYYTALPTFKAQTSDSNHGDKSAHSNKLDPANEIYAKLPIEFHTSIMDQLPLASFINLQRASSAARYLLTDANFWRKSIATDLPWLWDLPDSSAECDCEID